MDAAYRDRLLAYQKSYASTLDSRSAAHPDADEAVCDALAATYASASLHVLRREDDAAILTIRGAIRE